MPLLNIFRNISSKKQGQLAYLRMLHINLFNICCCYRQTLVCFYCLVRAVRQNRCIYLSLLIWNHGFEIYNDSELTAVIVYLFLSTNHFRFILHVNCSDVIMGAMASQTTRITFFLAATKFSPSVCLSVRQTLFAMFPSLHHPEIFRSYYQSEKWCPCKRSRSEVKGQGHRGHNPT